MKDQKIFLLIIVMCSVVFMLASCKSKTVEPQKPNRYLGEYATDTLGCLEEILTTEYDLVELQSWFEDKTFLHDITMDSNQDIISFSEVNQRFPVEVIRPGGYTVYAVKQGGYYYVFWSVLHLATNPVDDNSIVYLTAYLIDNKKVSDFNALKIGSSTARDVKTLDPSLELSFSMSSGVFSYSFLNDEDVLEIEYEPKSELDGYDDLIIKAINVIPRETAPSRYSMILPEDLKIGAGSAPG